MEPFRRLSVSSAVLLASNPEKQRFHQSGWNLFFQLCSFFLSGENIQLSILFIYFYIFQAKMQLNRDQLGTLNELRYIYTLFYIIIILCLFFSPAPETTAGRGQRTPCGTPRWGGSAPRRPTESPAASISTVSTTSTTSQVEKLQHERVAESWTWNPDRRVPPESSRAAASCSALHIVSFLFFLLSSGPKPWPNQTKAGQIKAF